jgi:hypothetical protein
MSLASQSQRDLPWRRVLSSAALGLLLLAPARATAQEPSPDMNFFLAPTGPTFGANQPALTVADQHCATLAYPLGFGHLTWRAYLTEGSTQARSRIGTGPWYNYYGVPIAENLAQLHSDENNLWSESAVTVSGDYGPPGFVIPPGSQLDGGDFTRRGPFFCFGVP